MLEGKPLPGITTKPSSGMWSPRGSPGQPSGRQAGSAPRPRGGAVRIPPRHTQKGVTGHPARGAAGPSRLQDEQPRAPAADRAPLPPAGPTRPAPVKPLQPRAVRPTRPPVGPTPPPPGPPQPGDPPAAPHRRCHHHHRTGDLDVERGEGGEVGGGQPSQEERARPPRRLPHGGGGGTSGPRARCVSTHRRQHARGARRVGREARNGGGGAGPEVGPGEGNQGGAGALRGPRWYLRGTRSLGRP